MAIITFAEIRERVARHQTTEAARNAPAAVACRALETLREALDEIGAGAERNEILREMRTVLCDAMLAEQPPMIAAR